MSAPLRGHYAFGQHGPSSLSGFLAATAGFFGVSVLAASFGWPKGRPRSVSALVAEILGSTSGVAALFGAGFFGYAGYLSGKAAVDIVRSELDVRPRVTSRLAESVPDAPQVVLDLGCGTGMTAAKILQRLPGVKLVCADVDPKEKTIKSNLFAEGLNNTDNVQVQKVEWTKLAFPDDHFDCVVGTFALDAAGSGADFDAGIRHLQLTLLREAIRVCKPGGKLIIWDTVESEVFASQRLSDIEVSEEIVAFGGVKTRIVSGKKVGRG